jgi:hypothetical protein
MTHPVIDVLNSDDPLIAVVGATDNPAKYGAVIYRHLKAKGYRVVAVNPNRDTVDGDPAFSTLADLPHPPDIINLVIPADRGLQVLQKAPPDAVGAVWVQPGAASSELLGYLEGEGLDHIAEACIMVASRRRPQTQDSVVPNTL